MFSEFKYDFPASIVVFFVAVPLCLGIALASGAPLFAGIIAGIIGGIVVGFASSSALGVSGPGNGLTILVLTSIASLDGSWPAFLTAVVLAGILQFLLGYFEAGFVAYFFPSSVIKGMLAGIGLLIILKQIPHALGYDKDIEGDFSFIQEDGETTLSALTSALDRFTPGAALIALVSISLLILWEVYLMKRHRLFQVLQGSLVSILLGIFLNYSYQQGWINLTLSSDQLVNIPVSENVSDFVSQLTFPDFSSLLRIEAWKAAVLIAIIASLETLLSVEAADRLDPFKRTTQPNRELMAQGLGNILSGLCGGLPITQVIVRSSVNISFGAKTKLSAILHGVFILFSALTLAEFLNTIPLASLAAILIVVGYKLTRPALYKEMYQLGWEQFTPFMATIIGMVITDLLRGISIGMAFGVFFTLRQNYYNSHEIKAVVSADNDNTTHHILLAEDLSFLTKASLMDSLNKIPVNSKVIIDGSKTKSIAFDVRQLIKDFQLSAVTKNINVETINIA